MATPIVTASSRNPYIDGILAENHWSDARPGPSTRIAFNVVGDDGRTEAFTRGIDDVTGLTGAAEEAAFKLALRLISDVSGLAFVEVAAQGTADMLLGAGPAPGQPGALGFASTPGGDVVGVKINSDNLATDSLTSLRQGGYDFITMLHEIGHSLGLKHPFSDGEFPPFPGVSGPGDLGDSDLNQGVYSVMGYDDGFPRRDGPGDTTVNEGWTGTPMAIDVAALQHLYGVNASHRTGNDTYALPADGGRASSTPASGTRAAPTASWPRARPPPPSTCARPPCSTRRAAADTCRPTRA